MQKHLKLILGRLRPMVLLDLGLAHAVDNLIDFWKARCPYIVFDVHVCDEGLGERLEEAIFRIVREALSNALRHRHPSRIQVHVRLETNNRIAIRVVDDGGGMAPTGSAIGFGITGMQERAALLGGTLTVHKRIDGNGVIVAAELPFDRSAECRVAPVKEAISA
jgi:two-component system sensor histidine kinase UhpB